MRKKYTHILTRNEHGGFQCIYQFLNGHGASVINNDMSRTGLGDVEVALLSQVYSAGELTLELDHRFDTIGHIHIADLHELLMELSWGDYSKLEQTRSIPLSQTIRNHETT